MTTNTNTNQLTKVVIFGTGLIGGSFALALKKQSAVKQIVGVGRNPVTLARALKLGIIDEVATDLSNALDGADFILIAAPVAQTESILRAIYPYLQKQTIVSDAGSTKSDVVAAARRALGEKIAQFVPAHPIAGRELHGPEASVAELFQGKKIVITALPENSNQALNLVASIWQHCGAVPQYSEPKQHDQLFAAVSHLPHLLAYAMINQIAGRSDADLYFQYAGSGFRDFTRIAGSSPEMWRDISLANRDALQEELAQYQAQLQRMATALQHEDGEQLLAMFSQAQEARQRWFSGSFRNLNYPTNHDMKTPHFPSYLDLNPVTHTQGVIHLPGSKSISNRILLLSALAMGETNISDLLASDDTLVMLNALQTLGVHWQQQGISQNYVVQGAAGNFSVKQADLFVGNAGTAIRPLVAALSVLGGDYTVHGVQRMHERPIGDLVDALLRVGADIAYTGMAGFPPLHIRRGHIRAHGWQVRGNVSSQFLTALLMAAPLVQGNQDVVIEVEGELISKPYIEITLNLMQRFGVTVQREGWQKFVIAKDQYYRSPGHIQVEGDASSASYFLAAGAICGGPVRVTGVGRNSIQGDVRFVDALEKMGASIVAGDNFIEARSNGALKAIDADFNAIPDAAMTIAIAALYANGTSVLRNIGSWRVKETDRIEAMATELTKLGAQVEAGADYLAITPPAQFKPASIATYDDHRMAMCFSLVTLNGALRTGTKVRILDPKCVAKTFPDFFNVFATIKQY